MWLFTKFTKDKVKGKYPYTETANEIKTKNVHWKVKKLEFLFLLPFFQLQIVKKEKNFGRIRSIKYMLLHRHDYTSGWSLQVIDRMKSLNLENVEDFVPGIYVTFCFSFFIF